MLWGLFRLTSGRPNFLVTCHVLASTAVTVPGLVLVAVFSYCASTHTSPTPGWTGSTGPAMVVLMDSAERLTTVPPVRRTSTAGRFTCHLSVGLVRSEEHTSELQSR